MVGREMECLLDWNWANRRNEMLECCRIVVEFVIMGGEARTNRNERTRNVDAMLRLVELLSVKHHPCSATESLGFRGAVTECFPNDLLGPELDGIAHAVLLHLECEGGASPELAALEECCPLAPGAVECEFIVCLVEVEVGSGELARTFSKY